MVSRGGAPIISREMPDSWLEDLAIAGDPEECAEKLQTFLNAGSDMIGLWLFPTDHGEEIAEITAREVLPRLN